MFADDVDGAFFGSFQVAQRVFGVGVAACEANGEERRVMINDVGVGEGGKICRGTCEGCQWRVSFRALAKKDRLQIVC